MKHISIYLAVSLMVVFGLVGLVVGYYLTPEYKLSIYEGEMGLGAADRSLDLRYINAMASHHRAAMLLAEQAQVNGVRPEIKTLAADILKNEPALIDELYSWKKDWYKDTRKVKDPDVAQLGPSDDKFDLRFLNAIIAHHEAGIEMTKEARIKSSRAEVLNNADAVEKFLTETGELFRNWRKSWYNI